MIGRPLRRKLFVPQLKINRPWGLSVVARGATSSPLSFSMLSNSPQGYSNDASKQLQRGLAAQVAEGNLFPNKPRSAVAVTACRVLESGKTEYLLIQRGKPPNYGEWSLPGGSIELGEGTLAAGVRELSEETNLRDSDVVFFRETFMTSDAIVRDAEGTLLFHYVIAQLFAVINADAQARAGDDAMAAGWFSIDDIHAQSFGKVTKDVLKVVERAAALRAAGLLPTSTA